MLRLELKNVVKYFQDRLILNISDLRIYDKEVVGIVGNNGSGKTTLLNIMSGQIRPDEGSVKVRGNHAYITQFDWDKNGTEQIDRAVAGRFNLPDRYEEFMSGGEKTRFKIAAVFSGGSDIIFADEPTANLDLSGIQLFEDTIKGFNGTVILVSHDRELLDKFCHKIFEIEDGQVTQYTGNYSNYVDQKEQARKRQESEYEKLVQERVRLKNALVEAQQQSQAVSKTPKRMGNSEARLHKMGNQRGKANIDKKAKAIKSRIEKLPTKEKPKHFSGMKLDLVGAEGLHSKIVVEGKNLNKSLGGKTLFLNAGFQLRNGEKTAVIGDNGSGKTTLIKMIMNCEEGIKISQKLKIGYFSQDLNVLDDQKTIIEELMESSVHDEAVTRTVLARLLFRRDDVYKEISVLSGGERVRLSLGKIVLSGFNMLILDEPTNYLDVHSMEAIEEVLAEYNGNLLFVSHDRKFVNKIATNILVIKNKEIVPFEGNYEQYLRWVSEQNREPAQQEQRILLEHRLSEIIGRLATPSKGDDIEALDREYKRILLQLKELH